MRLRVALLAVAAGLAVASPAAADTYTVTGDGDNSIPPGCTSTGSATWTCTMLRSAVVAANATGGEPDVIVITSPIVNLPVGPIQVTGDMTISGAGARVTTVDATGAGGPAFQITGGSTVFLGHMTIRDGVTANVDVLSGSAGLAFVRLTGATGGPGILNEDEVTVANSLIDGNAGGGIDNVGGPASVLVGSSTITGNTGFGIRSRFDVANEVDLIQTTIAHNSGTGLQFDGQQIVTANASIIANNGTNCAGWTLDGTFNVESTNTCGLVPTTNRVNSDPLLATGLSNKGGPTDVLEIPVNSPAADYLSPCVVGLDQRGFQRAANQPCDVGAYDREAVGPGDPGPEPTPTPTPPPPPAPPAQPTPTPTPTPVPNRSVVGTEERGTVKVKLPGTNRFVDLNAAQSLPNGSEIDARKGAIKIKAAPKAGAPPEEATFYDGLFKLSQSGGVTTLTLSEELDCPKQGKRASLLQKKAKKRKLWGDGKGAFRTKGKYSAATVRGTKWLVEDTCTTTTVRVTQGSVTVQDFVKRKRVVIRAGKRYVARAKR